jgi:hypothetical protein
VSLSCVILSNISSNLDNVFSITAAVLMTPSTLRLLLSLSELMRCIFLLSSDRFLINAVSIVEASMTSTCMYGTHNYKQVALYKIAFQLKDILCIECFSAFDFYADTFPVKKVILYRQ